MKKVISSLLLSFAILFLFRSNASAQTACNHYVEPGNCSKYGCTWTGSMCVASSNSSGSNSGVDVKETELGGTIGGLGGYDPGESIESASEGLSSFISNMVGLLTIVAGISFLIYFTVGGISWITAGGDKGKIEDAKSKMTGGAIGMIIVVSAWAISWIIGRVLGIDFLNPVETLVNIGPGN